MSWNIELGRHVGHAAQELKSSPELNRADIVLVQEMDQSGADRLASEIGMTSVYGSVATHRKTGRPFGNAVLSRWPIVATSHVGLPHVARFDGQPRSLVGATIRLPETDIEAYSIHLETVLLPLRRRVEQLRVGADSATGRSQTTPVVLGGDFNSASGRSIRQFDDALGLTSLRRATRLEPTFRRFGCTFALDHIYTKNVQVLESGVVMSTAASDHWPVWVELDLTTTTTDGGI